MKGGRLCVSCGDVWELGGGSGGLLIWKGAVKVCRVSKVLGLQWK